MIAMALACQPGLLIADEPAASLDIDLQNEILALPDRYRRTGERSVLLITHNIRLAARYTNRIAVLHGGVIVECGPLRCILAKPQHEQTRRLLAAAYKNQPNVISLEPKNELSFAAREQPV